MVNPAQACTAMGAPPEPLYVDEHLLIVEKPAGLLSVPGRGPDKQDCLITRLQSRWPQALTVHRLDQPTSGLMVFALSADVQSRLSALFRERQVDKRYVAVVHGLMAEDAGDITLPLLTDWPNRPRQMVTPDGKPSHTRWRVLARDAAAHTTRVELEPLTGRSHQLRVHLMSLGHPIVGDALYGPAPSDTGPADTAGETRLMLHANVLRFTHPVTGHAVTQVSSPPF